MPKKNQIKVIKVYLSKDEKPSDRPQAFSKIPRLYLELLENKSKIKQDLVNKEHIPVYQQSLQQDETVNLTPAELPEKNNIEIIEIIDSENEGSYHSGDEIKENKDKALDKDKDKAWDKDKKSYIRRNKDTDTDESTKDTSRGDESYKNKARDKDKALDKAGDTSVEDESYKEINKESNNEENNDEESNGDLSNRLKELLNDNSSSERYDSNDDIQKSLGRGGGNKYSKPREDKFKHKSSHRSVGYKNILGSPEKNPRAPTLAELQEQGIYKGEDHLRDINQVNMGDSEIEDKKRELLFKFELLKKSYPNAPIPEFYIHSDYPSMQRSYDDSVRRLSLDSTVENYKTYLIGGFMLTEFIFGNFLGFDMQGFTQQQIVSMNSYEKLLIELGEKSYVPTGSKFPVELRLIFLVIMNAAFFLVSKMIMKKTGANLMNMINNMNTGPTGEIPVRKRKMKGPNIDINDIPEL